MKENIGQKVMGAKEHVRQKASKSFDKTGKKVNETGTHPK